MRSGSLDLVLGGLRFCGLCSLVFRLFLVVSCVFFLVWLV